MNMRKKIPKLYLDVKSILDACEYQYIVMDSEIKHSGYVACEDEMILITRRNGYLRIDIEDIDKLIEELQGIKELAAVMRGLR